MSLNNWTHFLADNRIQQDFTWYNSFSKTFLNPGDIDATLQVRDSDMAILLPLRLTKRKEGLLSIREVYGFCQGQNDFFDPILIGDFAALCSAFLSHLKSLKTWDQVLIINLVRSDFSFHDLCLHLNENGYPAKFEEMSGFYFVNTEGDYQSFFESFIKPRNKDLLKDIRKLERNGISLSVRSVKEGIFLELEKVIDLYKQRRETLGQFNKYESPARRDFVKLLLEGYEPKGNAELSILEDESGVAWAFQLDWIVDGIRYHWNHAFNEDFKKYSPGKILLLRLLEKSFSDPEIVQVNHMRGKSGYKNKLADQFEPLFALTVVNPFSLNNRLKRGYYQISKVKKILQA